MGAIDTDFYNQSLWSALCQLLAIYRRVFTDEDVAQLQRRISHEELELFQQGGNDVYLGTFWTLHDYMRTVDIFWRLYNMYGEAEFGIDTRYDDFVSKLRRFNPELPELYCQQRAIICAYFSGVSYEEIVTCKWLRVIRLKSACKMLPHLQRNDFYLQCY